MKKIDIKYLGIPNICFSLTDKNDDREKEYVKQRIERGFDDSETWSLGDTIANFIVPRLELYIELASQHIIIKDDFKEGIESFLDAMKLLSRDNGIRIFNDKEKERVEKGLKAFPNIFYGLWW